MSKKTAVLSIGYWFSATTLGMLMHPYKTVREITRKESLRLSVLSPMVWIAIFWVMALMIVIFARLFADTFEYVYSSWLYSGVEFLFWWVMWFLILWQTLVGYLFFRFRRVFGE